jgi:hypothetical protein
MPMLRALILLPLLGGCLSEPLIRDLKYTPNAGLVGTESTITGSVTYTKANDEVSQSVVILYPPNGAPVVSPRTPIENVGQGVVGMVNFTLKFTPTAAGSYRFEVFIVDLGDHESNKLEGIIKVN